MEYEEIRKKLMRYPFYKKWTGGNLKKKLFIDNMNAFKEQIIQDEGITREEFAMVFERETKQCSSSGKNWYEFWK